MFPFRIAVAYRCDGLDGKTTHGDLFVPMIEEQRTRSFANSSLGSDAVLLMDYFRISDETVFPVGACTVVPAPCEPIAKY